MDKETHSSNYGCEALSDPQGLCVDRGLFPERANWEPVGGQEVFRHWGTLSGTMGPQTLTLPVSQE